MTDSSSTNSKGSRDNNDAAVDLIRSKVGNLYADEPNAKEEAQEVRTLDKPLSKHQAYMQKISESGMSLADIQTAWHRYYVGLPDAEKHDVWKEFYAEHDKKDSKKIESPEPPKKQEAVKAQPEVPHQDMRLPSSEKATVHHMGAQPAAKHRSSGPKTVREVKEQLISKASLNASGKLKARQHFQSLLFGVGMGMVVVIFLLFGFFNDRFIAPFITPSKNVSSTPIIIDGSTAVDGASKIIIPKINVEIPVVYDEPSVEEQAVQNALERGVVHYATTPSPGQKGNSVIFGHSSNNILNKGKYKFAFVLLNRLEVGDTFYLNKDGVRYVYKIYEKKIVNPSELGVLGSTDKVATSTLITCDPPGTTRNRLVVIGEQISPNPDSNANSTATAADAQATVLPSNAPSLWDRVRNWF